MMGRGGFDVLVAHRAGMGYLLTLRPTNACAVNGPGSPS